jgi:hypothetical protein
MSNHEDEALERDRLRFDIDPDGTVEGADGELATTLRYVCRMGGQIGALLGLGELERITTLSTVAVMVRVAGVSPHVSIRAEVERRDVRGREPVARVDVTARQAINQSLGRVIVDFGGDWAAIITDDKRLVGARNGMSTRRAVPAAVYEVGIRALAVLGALDEALRETDVRLHFVRGSVLVAALGDHALFAQADKFDESAVVTTVSAIQSLFRHVDLTYAHMVKVAPMPERG